jgi:hypothetical protein
LLSGASKRDDDEEHKMTRHLEDLARPRARDDVALVRAGREGTYWQAADGLVVRLAAPEAPGVADRDTEAAQRELLTLASHDAMEQ